MWQVSAEKVLAAQRRLAFAKGTLSYRLGENSLMWEFGFDGGHALFLKHTKSIRERAQLEVVQPGAADFFDWADANGDGRISFTEASMVVEFLGAHAYRAERWPERLGVWEKHCALHGVDPSLGPTRAELAVALASNYMRRIFELPPSNPHAAVSVRSRHAYAGWMRLLAEASKGGRVHAMEPMARLEAMQPGAAAFFNWADADGDGYITFEEVSAVLDFLGTFLPKKYPGRSILSKLRPARTPMEDSPEFRNCAPIELDPWLQSELVHRIESNSSERQQYYEVVCPRLNADPSLGLTPGQLADLLAHPGLVDGRRYMQTLLTCGRHLRDLLEDDKIKLHAGWGRAVAEASIGGKCPQ